MRVFVDTAAWIALINQRDVLHDPALEISKNLRQKQVSLVTTEFVLLEVDKILFDAGWQLYKQRLDKEWSLTDCISFVVMRQESITQAFTSDRHFEQAGFMKLL